MMIRLYARAILSLSMFFTALMTVMMLIGYALKGDLLVFSTRDFTTFDYHLFILDIGLRTTLPLTTNAVITLFPPYAVSPDGNWIAFTQATPRATYLEIMNIYTEESIIIYEGDTINSLVWSPDSEVLAYAFIRGGYEMYFMRENRVGIQSASNLRGGLSFSSDASAIVFSTFREDNLNDIFTLEIGGSMSQRRIIYQNATNDLNPLWSPDGQYVAFLSNDPRTVTINVYDMQTETITPVFTGENGSLYNLSWSPTSHRLAFGTFSTNRGLFITNPDGTNPIQITQVQLPYSPSTWSPDGNRIAFIAENEGLFDLMISEVDGTQQYCVLCGVRFGALYNPVWLP